MKILFSMNESCRRDSEPVSDQDLVALGAIQTQREMMVLPQRENKFKQRMETDGGMPKGTARQ